MSSDNHLSLWLAVETAEAEPVKALGFHKIDVGSFTVTAIYDGEAPLPIDKLLTGTTPADARQHLAEGQSPSPVGISVNAFFVKIGEQSLLIDTDRKSVV